jgi:acylphosphatase
MSECRKCLVSGRVQGVYFRAATRRRARELGVTGYARNLPDGRVEVVACGARGPVESLCEWLWEGPPGARVSTVDCAAAETEPPDDFTVV